jgi:hypothetical protein
LNYYRCTLFHHNYTLGDEDDVLDLEYHPAVRIARVGVLARTARQAAARAYVRTVGRARARKLWEISAPMVIVLAEAHWRVMARWLDVTNNWLGRCFVHDNQVEAFYIRVELGTASPRAIAGRLARRRRLLWASRTPSPN